MLFDIVEANARHFNICQRFLTFNLENNQIQHLIVSNEF